MSDKPYQIDLDQLIPKEVTALNTRIAGISLRNASNIDQLANDHKQIVISIPKRITWVSTAFMEEFLANIILKFRGQEIEERIRLVCEGEDVFRLYLVDAVDRLCAKEFGFKRSMRSKQAASRSSLLSDEHP